jgi:hypothetical protein
MLAETPATPFISPLSGGKLGTHAALLRSAVLTRSFFLPLGFASLTPTYARCSADMRLRNVGHRCAHPNLYRRYAPAESLGFVPQPNLYRFSPLIQNLFQTQHIPLSLDFHSL